MIIFRLWFFSGFLLICCDSFQMFYLSVMILFRFSTYLLWFSSDFLLICCDYFQIFYLSVMNLFRFSNHLLWFFSGCDSFQVGLIRLDFVWASSERGREMLSVSFSCISHHPSINNTRNTHFKRQYYLEDKKWGFWKVETVSRGNSCLILPYKCQIDLVNIQGQSQWDLDI